MEMDNSMVSEEGVEVKQGKVGINGNEKRT